MNATSSAFCSSATVDKIAWECHVQHFALNSTVESMGLMRNFSQNVHSIYYDWLISLLISHKIVGQYGSLGPNNI